MTGSETPEATAARAWLAELGVVQSADGWLDTDEPDRPLTSVDVAQDYGRMVFDDAPAADDGDDGGGAGPDRSGQLRLAFGLVELLDVWWATAEIRFAHRGPAGPLPAGELWGGYRQLLEAERHLESVVYSLWVDWFEDRATVEEAFTGVLGADIDRIAARGTAAELRRAARVLECSGPVPWPLKEPVYRRAAAVPALHPALFRGLLTSYHDFYGDLEPQPALALLGGLRLPPETEHLARLRRVLRLGLRNHHRNPEVWAD